jgi:hypothetical protein
VSFDLAQQTTGVPLFSNLVVVVDWFCASHAFLLFPRSDEHQSDCSRPFKKPKMKTKHKGSSAIVPGLSLAVDMARGGVVIPEIVSPASDTSSKQDYTKSPAAATNR